MVSVVATYQSRCAVDIGGYVGEQLARADQLSVAHQPDGATGCCRACGRPAPCETTTHVAWLRERYGSWEETQPVGLVRPYVLHEVRGGKW